MIIRKFEALDKTRAIRKTLDCWYRHYRDDLKLKDFMLYCTGMKEEKQYVITFVGPPPKAKK